MKCSGIDCPNYAEKLKCPTCVKLGLPEAYFCSQECFKENWAVHKIFHQAKIEQSNTPERFRGFAFTGPLRPGLVSPMRTVPPHIPRPDYADNGIPIGEKKENPAIIPVYTPNEIEKMKTVCRMSREVLEIAASLVKPGVTGEEIDEVVHNACIERGAYPSPLNYYNYPKSCCISVNEVICHGIPDSRKLEEGDIVNIDISLFYDGVHGDVNDTYFVGEVDDESKHLVKTTRECLDKAIEIVKPGTMYRQLGEVITRHATRNNLSVVRTYCGHGVGMLFHCSPSVPHYSKNKAVGVMKPGHIFTIEPMINVGTWKDKLWPDDWTATTMDGKRSAQFEETILVTEDGYEVLTAGNRNYNF